MADEANKATEGTTEPKNDPTTPPAQQPKPMGTKPPSYEELYTTDKTLQSFIDKIVTKSTQTAVANALQKQQRLTDEKLTEAERLQAMTSDEKARYFEQKYKEAEAARVRDKETESLKAQTVAMLAESKIPEAFLDVFSFESATADDVKKRVDMLAGYEYHPKGEFEKLVTTGITAGVNERLKQKPPEHRQQGLPEKETDPFLMGFYKNDKKEG